MCACVYIYIYILYSYKNKIDQKKMQSDFFRRSLNFSDIFSNPRRYLDDYHYGPDLVGEEWYKNHIPQPGYIFHDKGPRNMCGYRFTKSIDKDYYHNVDFLLKEFFIRGIVSIIYDYNDYSPFVLNMINIKKSQG